MHRLRLLGDYTVRVCAGRSSAPTIHRRSIHAGRHAIVYGDDVATARRNGTPIVALESTIITHGMPYPDNLDTALRVENAIRKQGAVPATIGIIGGTIHVGLNEQQLKILSKADSSGSTVKCSRRDVSSIVSRKLDGGTTVSATMLIARAAGIPIMATGGIGGVHRGAELTFDVSADMTELGRTPVAVVCSGVKSILDIGKTLEYLETEGVPVIKIGETPEFPAFYCTETLDRIQAPCRVSSAEEAAAILESQRALGINTGILFAVPIPGEHALMPAVVESAISEALRKASSMNVTGKRVTPFILSELNEITSGKSLEANTALVENNARIAAEIACKLREGPGQHAGATIPARASSFLSRRKPVVVGGAVLDTVLQVKEPRINNDGRTHAGRSRRSCGGVGRNVADALIKLGMKSTRLISVVGRDDHGKIILESLGIGGSTVTSLPDVDTARFTVIVDAKGESYLNVKETDSFSAIVPELIKERQSHLEEASIIILDGNVPLDTMRYVLDVASHAKTPVWYEPTDVKLAAKIFATGTRWRGVLHFVSPNLNELKVIGEYWNISGAFTGSDDLAIARGIAERLVEHVPVVVTTLGSQGVVVTRRTLRDEPFYDETGRLIANSPTIVSRLYPVPEAAGTQEILSVSGCGDCLAAGMIYGIHNNLDESKCVALALKSAALSLRTFDAVPQTLTGLPGDDTS